MSIPDPITAGDLADHATVGAVNPRPGPVAQARYLSVRTTDADNQSAIALLERAIELDPRSRAHAELASAYVTRLAYVTPDETRELEEKAFSAAEKALSLDPTCPKPIWLAGTCCGPTHNASRTSERSRNSARALALNPNSDQAHRRLARVFVHVGFFDEALQHADLALTINPSNAQALNSRAQALLWMGKDEEALAIFQSIPGPVLPELVEANTVFALLRLGDERRLVAICDARCEVPNDPSGNLPAMEALLLADPTRMARRRLIGASSEKERPTHLITPRISPPAPRRACGAPEAVQWLREAAATGFPCYSLFARDPNLDPIRTDPEFQAFMAEMQKSSASLRRTLFPDSK